MIGLFAQATAQPHYTLDMLGVAALAAVIFGAIGVVMLLAGYWLFDLITPRIDVQKELNEKNLAVAIVVGALLLGIAYIVAQVVSA